jgi:hypothetical protein
MRRVTSRPRIFTTPIVALKLTDYEDYFAPGLILTLLWRENYIFVPDTFYMTICSLVTVPTEVARLRPYLITKI